MEGKRGTKKKGRKLKKFYTGIQWDAVTSNIERLPYLAEQIKRNTPKRKAAPAQDGELFLFARDYGWKERLPADAMRSD